MTDPRVTPARPDLAAIHLKGKVEAARFAEGMRKIVLRGTVPLHAAPDETSMRDTELLRGETFTVYESKDGCSWGQAARDDYVGYAPTDALVEPGDEPDHRIVALSTPLLRGPSLKTPPLDMLPLNARVRVIGRDVKCLAIAGGGFVFEKHIAPFETTADDWVAVAEQFVGVPYIWGGRTHAGLDCSGLLQTALEAGGILIPRDADQQETALAVKTISSNSALKRGDIVFWTDHVGIMLDATRLLHANGFWGQTSIEPLDAAVQRNEGAGNKITSIKRL
jgi:cell wall-associated NlpC family hydrolase